MIFASFLFSLFVQTAPVDTYHSAPTRYSIPLSATGRTVVSSEAPRSTKPWDGHFAAKNFDNSKEKTALNTIKKNLRTVVIGLPKDHTAALKSLEVRNERHVSRGLANSKKIILNTGNIDTDDELKAVFVHELGHVVDLGRLKGYNQNLSEFKDGSRKIYTDDPSVQFYRLSWKDSDTKRSSASRYDFISEYGMTTPFEDFAESYLFYRLHGAKFRAATAKSTVLAQKYNFLRDQVFAGKEFQTDQYVERYVPGLIWDATLLSHGGL